MHYQFEKHLTNAEEIVEFCKGKTIIDTKFTKTDDEQKLLLTYDNDTALCIHYTGESGPYSDYTPGESSEVWYEVWVKKEEKSNV